MSGENHADTSPYFPVRSRTRSVRAVTVSEIIEALADGLRDFQSAPNASHSGDLALRKIMERAMPSDTDLLEHLYDRFNARDMEAVRAIMHRDVVWANGLEGGHVYGHDGVRDYWTRQWSMMDSHVEPISISTSVDGTTHVEVRLTARDLKGNLLFDKTGGHIFRIEDGLIRGFNIR